MGGAARFFTGMELLAPGLVPVDGRRPPPGRGASGYRPIARQGRQRLPADVGCGRAQERNPVTAAFPDTSKAEGWVMR